MPLTGFLSDTLCREWAGDLDQLAFKGSRLIEEVFFLHKASRTLIVGDLIQNWLPMQGRPIRNALARLVGVNYPHGGVAIDLRLTFTNRRLARLSLDKLLSWDFDRLILAHGACIERGAKGFVERAFRWLVS